MIKTERLVLRPGTIPELEADLAGPAALSRALGVEVPAEWPPELYDAPAIQWTINCLREQPSQDGFGFYYFIHVDGARPTAIGVGGFKGGPIDGVVEIGYGVLAAFRCKGFASEAVRGLLAHAFGDDRVERVIAETLPDLTPSRRVLEKTGFTFVGDGSEEGVIRYAIERSG